MMSSQEPTDNLNEPYGGTLINLLATGDEREEALRRALISPRVQLSLRSLCDLELLATGAFSPLDRFMGREDYERVLEEMRLAKGGLFPIPLTLPLDDDAPGLRLDAEIALADQRNEIIALMRVEEIYEWDLGREARKVYGTNDLRHPLVAEMHSWGKSYVSGKLTVLSLPSHYDFRNLRLTPAATRERLGALGRENVVAFQTRNPLHRGHEELTRRAAESVQGSLLLHPSVGMTKPGDIDHFTRVRSYKILTERYYDARRTLLALLPLAMRMAGPREALWHGLIRRNFGASHFIVGRDHASPGRDSRGNPFYDPAAAQELFAEHESELGVRMISFDEMVYLPEEDRFEERSRAKENRAAVVSLSGTAMREDYLERGRPLPAWFARREVSEALAQAHPPRHRQGFCVWFTGLSASGKSTTAEILTVLLLEHGRQATVLDGDVVRTHLSHGLGFSREDRDVNVRRIGFVASEIVRHDGAVICAAVSPYRAARNECRAMVGGERYVEVFVNTPLDICELRDKKGMYAQAREGRIKNFTGIDDPYEPPHNPEIVLDTLGCTAEENARLILAHLVEKGFVLAAFGDASREGDAEERESETISSPATSKP